MSRKIQMADVVRAHMEVRGCPVLTSNQCHAIAMKLNCQVGAPTLTQADFDRVTAERDAALARLEEALAESLANQNEREVVCVNYEALQQRLTAADERADVLEGLIGEVLDAVGREPLDLDAVLRLCARMRAALKPAEAPRNQCDGCQAGIPLINGTHRMGREGGYPDFMGCSAKLYKPAEGSGDD